MRWVFVLVFVKLSIRTTSLRLYILGHSPFCYSVMDVYIVGAVRTPIGCFSESLSSFRASELGAIVIREALNRAAVQPEEVSEVIMGQVLTAMEGQNTARQASCGAGIPYSVPAYTVNMVCGSGLKSVMLGAQSIMLGDSHIVVCGGQESMSRAPHAVHLRTAHKLGNVNFTDTMIHDGLTDAFHKYHMGITAENIAAEKCISRHMQDKYSVLSQQKAESARQAGKFINEIISVNVPPSRKGELPKTLERDEFPKPDTTFDALSKLKPAFTSEGSVTAGNASGVNDGAAALVLMSGSEVAKRRIKPLARIVSFSQRGIDPSIMGLGPVDAVREAVKKAGWTLDSVDLFEINEAFAAQSIAVISELGLCPGKCNVNGGAIALGHPIGASGSRILVTLVHAMVDRQLERGVAALCIGGGMGVAMCIEQ